MIIAGLIAIPYIDINPKGKGYYTLKERPFALITFCFGFFVLGSADGRRYLLEGPGWNFFAPWKEWDPHKVVPLTNVNLLTYLASGMNSPLVFSGCVLSSDICAGSHLLLFEKRNERISPRVGFGPLHRCFILFLTMMALPIKMILRWTLNIKYIWFLHGLISRRIGIVYNSSIQTVGVSRNREEQ